jgi:hypothetical protein
VAMHALPADYLKAGADYLAALRKLGLDPEGLLWAYDRTISEFALVLITSQFDHVGPTEIYRSLTAAYNLAATPSEISPFIVRLHSPKQAIVTELRRAYGWDVRVDSLDDKFTPVIQYSMDVGDLNFAIDWVYQIRDRKLAPAERARRWQRFQRNVEALAA